MNHFHVDISFKKLDVHKHINNMIAYCETKIVFRFENQDSKMVYDFENIPIKRKQNIVSRLVAFVCLFVLCNMNKMC